jgi:hypothetical protein
MNNGSSIVLHWPQIAFLVLVVMNLTGAAASHGVTEVRNVVKDTFRRLGVCALLWFGGFFTGGSP